MQNLKEIESLTFSMVSNEKKNCEWSRQKFKANKKLVVNKKVTVDNFICGYFKKFRNHFYNFAILSAVFLEKL